MVDLPVDIVLEKLINVCSGYLQDQVGWQTGMKPEMRKLQENLIKIKAVVADSSHAQTIGQNQDLLAWRWQLRDAIDEADDLLDDFEYMKRKEQLIRRNMEETRNLSDTTRFLLEGASRVRERALKMDQNLTRLVEVVQKLDKVSAEFGTFLHLIENTKKEQQKQELELYKIRETGSLPKNVLIGRGEDVKYVMEWLRKPSNEDPTHITGSTLYNNISLLSIVGHGGMGKTTLLQHVYEDLKDEFDLKLWVCVSIDFDPKKVIANMLEHLEKDRYELESLAVLQRNLKSMVHNKKFLLVLDDIWEDEGWDKSKWENVLSSLAYGSMGSKILVTTRMDSVASMIAKMIGKKKLTLRLKGLKEDECLKLFNAHAFTVEDNLEDHKNLRHMAKEIVKKLSGSPLAAKVIGAALNHNLDETHWRCVLNNNIGSAALGMNAIMPILRLSYALLPKPLQHCFTFCSIFPQDNQFDKDDLIRMWISLGFIQAPSTPGVTMEDIGGRYFNTLVKKSFFEMHESHNKIYYTIHDLLHELAKSISAHECFHSMGTNEIPPETVRHLFVNDYSLRVIRKIRKLENLHSLFLTCWGKKEEFIYVLKDILEASRSIRLLSVFSHDLIEIPDAIGKLTHLRYLNISLVTGMPEFLSRLYHLQFIINRASKRNPFILPTYMNNLTNLRYLDFNPPRTYLEHREIFFGMSGIGKLTSLQELNGFYIDDINGLRIGELEHMNSLRLLNIHNLRDAKEAHSAKLNKKIYLRDLSLNFRNTNLLMNSDLDEIVLENLQPPSNLNKLSISSYMGAKSAKWMGNAKLISNLKEIELKDCLFWETLPPFEQLPFLKSLSLDNMPKVKQFNDKFCLFTSLERLRIRNLEALVDWLGALEDECLFPCLTELYLEACPNLLELPTLPPKLEKLEMNRVMWNALNWKQEISNCGSISKSISLKKKNKKRKKENCTFLPLADETVRLEALRYLTIQHCPNLISLSGLQHVGTSEHRLPNFPSSVEFLCLKGLESLQCLPPLSTIFSLKELYIEYVPLQHLPSLSNISSLKRLSLIKIPQLKSLPDLPSSLEKLYIENLESLVRLPSSLSTIFSLKELYIEYVPLQRLPSLSNISSLKRLSLIKISLLKSLDLPSSLEKLYIENLESLDRLPSSLSTFSYLKNLKLSSIPILRSLPVLSPSLEEIFIQNFESLECLPSSLSTISSLRCLSIEKVPLLRQLPDPPSSLKVLHIEGCHEELRNRYDVNSGSDRDKLAHIPDIRIS